MDKLKCSTNCPNKVYSTDGSKFVKITSYKGVYCLCLEVNYHAMLGGKIPCTIKTSKITVFPYRKQK